MIRNLVLPVLVAGVVIVSCFFTWITVAEKGIYIGGLDSNFTDYGKPGVLHIALASIYLLLIFPMKAWSFRAAFFFAALNIAWAIRNYFLLTACKGGLCPEKHAAFYVLLGGSLLMVLVLFGIRLRSKNQAGA